VKRFGGQEGGGHQPIGGCGTKTRIQRFRGTEIASETKTMLGTILLIILILALIGALPSWGHSRNWGYGPSGGLGLVVLILIILLLMGRI
jgi:hypothetical protein